MGSTCGCGKEHDGAPELSCLECGAPTCSSCAITLEAASYCARCAVSLLDTTTVRAGGTFDVY